jgi:predicted nucleic acid-binding Zn ribbon protein
MATERDRPAQVSGQPDTELPPPVAMTGVVQPRGHAGVELRCLICGQMFTAKRRDRRTCSRQCGRIDAAARRDTESVRRCAHCGQPLETGRSDRRYCDVRCRMRAYRRRRRDRTAGQ